MTAGRADRSFPKAYRLVSSEDFRRVYRDGTRGREGPFTWHARLNTREHARLGLAVPKRVVKRATERSRIKRVIRESFRHHRSRLPAADIVVSVRALPRELHAPGVHGRIARIWEAVLRGLGEAR